MIECHHPVLVAFRNNSAINLTIDLPRVFTKISEFHSYLFGLFQTRRPHFICKIKDD